MVFLCPPKDEATQRNKLLGDLRDLVETIEDKLKIPCETSETIEPSSKKPPDVMICYQTKKTVGHSAPTRVKKSKSRELRAGILYVGCDCERRYGLQDDCLRSDCRGSPECLTKPPSCGPSEYCNGKHLGKKRNYTNTIEDDTNERTTYQFKCYPATIKCVSGNGN